MLRETALSSAARNSADYSNGNGPGVQCFFPLFLNCKDVHFYFIT